MQISTLTDGPRLTFIVEGRMDNNTAAGFDETVRSALRDGITDVVLDFSSLTYLSSMGLRSLLTLQRLMDQKKMHLTLRNVGADIMEILNMTGFSHIFEIQ